MPNGNSGSGNSGGNGGSGNSCGNCGFGNSCGNGGSGNSRGNGQSDETWRKLGLWKPKWPIWFELPDTSGMHWLLETIQMISIDIYEQS